jgi:hypothetical protein
MGLLSVAVFIVVVIHPGGFEGQLGWAWALMPGTIVGPSVAYRVSEVFPNSYGLVFWVAAIVITFLWYFAISYGARKDYRLLVREKK